jgi:CheY-like chemotaxis protein
MPTTVTLVGHCGFDAGSLVQLVRDTLPGANVAEAHSDVQLAQAVGPSHVLLINRVLDGSFNAGDGIELIGQLRKRPDPPTCLLISNYADAQQQAEQAGAMPGFGKSELCSQTTRARLQDAAGCMRIMTKSE